MENLEKIGYIDPEKQKVNKVIEEIKQLLQKESIEIKIYDEMPDEFLNRKPQYERFHRAGQFIETEEKLFAVYSNGKIEEIDLTPYSVADIREGGQEDIVEDKDKTGLAYDEIIKKNTKSDLEYLASYYKHLKETGKEQENKYKSVLEIYKIKK